MVSKDMVYNSQREVRDSRLSILCILLSSADEKLVGKQHVG